MAFSAGVAFGMLAMLCYGLSDFLAKKTVEKHGPAPSTGPLVREGIALAYRGRGLELHVPVPGGAVPLLHVYV